MTEAYLLIAGAAPLSEERGTSKRDKQVATTVPPITHAHTSFGPPTNPPVSRIAGNADNQPAAVDSQLSPPSRNQPILSAQPTSPKRTTGRQH